LLAAAFALFAVVLVRNAWLGEDAYIGLRTVENFINGDGLTWNVNERVQVYTCPLWILIHCGALFVTRETFYTSIFLSFVASLLAMLVVWRSARGDTQGLLAVTVLVCSKAFVDYSTSGLENPLTYLLVAAFVAIYLRYEPNLKSLFALSLVAALAVTNRMDVAALLAPALLYAFWRVRGLRAAGVVLLASTPFVLWEAFSLFYYGFLFPNTAYAKLGTGVSGWESARQGLYYFRDSLSLDPLTLLAIGVGMAAPFVTRQWRQLPLAAGMALYLVYVVKVGGDFMSGRFFTAPLVIAACLLGQIPITAPRLIPWALAEAAVLLLGLIAPGSPLRSGEDYQSVRSGFGPNDHGIADERGYYYPYSGLLPTWRRGGEPTHCWVDQGRDAQARGIRVVVKGNVGYFAYYAGRDVYVVDPGALTDPLLARLPAVRMRPWRIGHFTRVIPEGYAETLADGENHLADPKLAEYYDHLSYVVRGPLFDRERLREIWRINTGAYNHLIDFGAYRESPPLARRYSEISRVQPSGKGLYFGPNGIDIDLENCKLRDRVELSLDNDDRYDVLFLRGDEELARVQIVQPAFTLVVGLNLYEVEVPENARDGKCDRIRIVPAPLANDGAFNLGHIRIVDKAPNVARNK
jgi:arabinofuranosyltransferase